MKRELLFDNKALVKLLVPLVIEQLLATLVGMADSIMIASVGEAAVSGVSLVDQVMVLVMQLFSAMATGGAVVAGQYLGQKSEQNARKATAQLMGTLLFLSVLIMAVTYGGRHFILHTVFGSIEQDVMGHANIYLLIVSASIPFIALYNGGAAIFRTMGESQLSMKVSMIMNVINVAGNAIMIYGLHCGTEGVAIPTLISRIVAAAIMIQMLRNPDRVLCLKLDRSFRPDFSMIKKILGIGIPNSLENSMFQLGKILVLSMVSTYGTYAIAANAVSNTVSLFSILPGMAMALGITTVISRCVGAGDYEQAKYYNKKLHLYTHICMLFTVAIVLATLPWILKAYNLSEEAASATRQILWFHGICTVLFWPESFILPCVFRAAGDAKFCMLVSTLSMWIFRIGFSYVLGTMLHWGVFGVWAAMIIDWVARVICFGIRYFTGKWQHKPIV